ncbi:hypothetical protein L0337_44015 [candidate division KSB1 bacterium]|nr:hypothetical protein [candidate division KSB1 bacterium]
MAEQIKVIRVVLDTNIFLRSLIRKGNISDKFVDCSILGRVQNLVSEDNDLLEDKNLRKQLFEYGVEVLNAFEFYQQLQSILSPSNPLPDISA